MLPIRGSPSSNFMWIWGYLRLFFSSVTIRSPRREATSRVSFEAPAASHNPRYLTGAAPPLVTADEAVRRYYVMGGLLYGILWVFAGRRVYRGFFAMLRPRHSSDTSGCIGGLTGAPQFDQLTYQAVQDRPVSSRDSDLHGPDGQRPLPSGGSAVLPCKAWGPPRPADLV